MIPARGHEFPPEQQALLARARRLEWWSLAYTASAATVLFLVMGTSQAMRTSFFDDAISIVPAIVFLIASRIAPRSPTERYPYGYHSATSIGFLAASLALAATGTFLLIEGGQHLLSATRTSIGGTTVFGETIWAGWLMLAALVYSSVPAVILGRVKLRMAPQLHDKVLFADAKMMKADWMAAVATAFGVLGVGFGVWWMDPLAAIVVSIDILRDGVTNVGTAVADLIKERPRKTDGSGIETLPQEVTAFLRGLEWVEDAEVRMREDGHAFFGEAFVVPRTSEGLPQKIEQCAEAARGLNWRLHELCVMPVERLPGR